MEDSLRLSDEENLVYNVIKQETKASGGILQSRLGEKDELRGIQPRRLSTIVNKLVRAKLVKRIAVDNNGQQTYLLQAINRNEWAEEKQTLDLDVFTIPCYGCRNLYMCGVGRSYNPLKCPYLTRFLIERLHAAKL